MSNKPKKSRKSPPPHLNLHNDSISDVSFDANVPWQKALKSLFKEKFNGSTEWPAAVKSKNNIETSKPEEDASSIDFYVVSENSTTPLSNFARMSDEELNVGFFSIFIVQCFLARVGKSRSLPNESVEGHQNAH